MARTAQKAKANSADADASVNSSSSSSSGEKSEVSMDFLSNPQAPLPSSESSSSSSADEETGSESANNLSLESPLYEDVNEATQSPEPKVTSKPKTTAGTSKKRKQEKPKKKRNQVDANINRLRSTTNLLVPRLPFQRLVREIMGEISESVDRITGEALGALQSSSESFLVQVLEDSYLLTLHRGRVTLTDRDLRLVLYLRDPSSMSR